MSSAKDRLAKKKEHDEKTIFLDEPIMISGPKPPRTNTFFEGFFSDPLWPLITAGGAATVYALSRGFKALSKKDYSVENLQFQNKMMRMRIGAQFGTVMVCFVSYMLFKSVNSSDVKPQNSNANSK